MASKLSQLEFDSQKRISSCLLESRVIAWSVRDLIPANVPVKNSLKLAGKRLIHNIPRLMFPKHNELVRKEISNILEVGIIFWCHPLGSLQ